ncbi:ABC transporter substrate-binding protein [Bradyrhizobium stylosanthis]|uniref:ABC-type branched-subunit amino acid transport system substrate-binding protein n=1 Tax=Bradyrhizobium stylosanthis TaxID=1803665 RepID=A0A560DR46_9BRAD|nr:ABC transporter substrate-binding protein [Bradyrhizobium stylosanthis]TWA99586.1 ABC-type branched-subunit amino acid transport system substrate-binding protein [Bradyrhizobium stylosanthis]
MKPRLTMWLAVVAGVVLVLAVAWAAVLWTRPEPVRIAFANSLSGPSAATGTESLVATQLAIDEVNAKGGVNGRPIELVLFDDASNPAVARANAQAIADSPCVAVLGHYLSSASLAAAPVYKDARIPALTGSSAADELTSGSDYYFRALSPVSVQARSIAEHLRAVMKEPKVRLVHTRDSYGKSFERGFATAYPAEQLRVFGLDVAAGQIGSTDEALDSAAQESGPAVIVVGAATDFSADIVKALRRRGIKGTIIASQAAARESYLQNFANEPEEKAHPGFFSDNLYAASSLMFDSAGVAAQVFAADYKAKAGTSPSWVAGGSYDAARLMIDALKRAAVHPRFMGQGIQKRSDSKVADRDRVRVALAAIDSPKSAVVGLTGRLYFNANRDIPRPIRLGFFRYGLFVTAPLQLVPIDQPYGIDLAAEREAGHVVMFGDRHYWIQRVVYTGIDIVRVTRIDVRQNSFSVDFYLWMRFAGDDEAQTHVEFPALADRGAFDPAQPIQAGREDGLSYRLYRISSDFKARFDLHDYPFDTQQLRLHLQNTEQRRELITYVIDRFGLRLADDGNSRAEDGAYSGLQLWRFIGLSYFVDSLSTGSTLGRASLFGAEASMEFAGFNAVITLRRTSAIYMLKNLLPLFLLVLVVFATLFFPETMFRERVTIPVTSILASAVLLVAVNGQIGDVGYTVVVEEMFYIFFVLCLMTMLAGYKHEKLRDAGRKRAAVVLDHAAQVIYAGTVLAVIVVLYRRYAG